MQTIKQVTVKLVLLREEEFLPKKEDMEFGKFYYSKALSCSTHLCLCGCGNECFLPIETGEWMIVNHSKFTVSPSIQQRFGCESHYIIVNGKANFV